MLPLQMRLIRHWDIKALEDADLNNVKSWRIIGLEGGLPLSTVRPPNEEHNIVGFEKDHPGSPDAPGLKLETRKAAGQLQEFLVGNDSVAGVYYQIYTFFDGLRCRVVDSEQIQLEVQDYRDYLQLIDNGKYLMKYGSRLLLDTDPSLAKRSITSLPKDFKFDGENTRQPAHITQLLWSGTGLAQHHLKRHSHALPRR
jgi:hypothetical protein